MPVQGPGRLRVDDAPVLLRPRAAGRRARGAARRRAAARRRRPVRQRQVLGLRAGLLPALAGGVLPGSEAGAGRDRPGEHPLRELRRARRRRRRRACVLVVDQFEETFTVCRDEARARARSSPRWPPATRASVVVLARPRGPLRPLRGLPGLVEPLAAQSRARRRDAPRRAAPGGRAPAQRAGLRSSPSSTDALVADVEAEPGALPLLSTALLELWQHRDGGACASPTYERHRRRARRGGAARRGRLRHASTRPAGARARGSCCGWPARARRGGRAPAGPARRARRRRGTRRSRVAGRPAAADGQRRHVEVAHEALLREWPRLRGWLEEDAEGRRLHRRLADAAREWDEAGATPATSTAARGWRPRWSGAARTRTGSTTPSASSSRRPRAGRARAPDTGGRRGRDRAARADHRGLAVLAVRGRAARRDASGAPPSRARWPRGARPARGQRRARRAAGPRGLPERADVEARSAVLSVLPSLAGYRRLGAPLQHGPDLQGVAISPDGRTLATATKNGRVSLWDVATRRRLGPPLAGHGGDRVQDVTFSPDGRRLASAAPTRPPGYGTSARRARRAARSSRQT